MPRPSLCLLLVCGLASSPAIAAEILWARGPAEGNAEGRYADGANWDGGRIPGPADRARVDRGGSVMTLDSTIVANNFLFGVNERDQTFRFTEEADVTLARNCIVAHNRGGVTADFAPGSSLRIGESLVVGQEDEPGRDDEDVAVYLRGDAVMRGGIILGLRYSGDVSGVDLLVEISGTVRADNLLVANDTENGGDAEAFLAAGLNNSARVTVTPTGVLTLAGNKTAHARELIERGILGSSLPGVRPEVVFDGRDTVVTSPLPEPE